MPSSRTVEINGTVYSVGQMIGDGAFAKVFLAFNPAGERVALKVIPRCRLETSRIVARQVQDEVLCMERLRSDHIVQLLDHSMNVPFPLKRNRSQDSVVLVQELVACGELFDFLQYTGAFGERIARYFFRQLLQGLEDCHRQGVVHRDIKPENLLLDKDYALRIADFGFAKVFHNDTGDSVTMRTELGTQGYQAPEVLRKPWGSDGYTEACDVFSAGVVLFVCLAGFPPFAEAVASTDWWFNKLSSGDTDLFWEAHQRSAFFSDTVKPLLIGMLAPTPAKRLTLREIREHEWFEGDTATPEELVSEITRRHLFMQGARSHEAGSVIVGGGAGTGGGAGADDVFRSASGPVLPLGPPPMRRGLAKQSNSSPSSGEQPEGQEPSDLNPNPNPNPDTPTPASAHDAGRLEAFDDFISSFTMFYSSKGVDDLLGAVANVLLLQFDGKITPADDDDEEEPGVLEAAVKLGKKTLAFRVQVFHHGPSQLNVVVVFRQDGVDPIRFMKFYAKLEDRLSGSVAPRPVHAPLP